MLDLAELAVKANVMEVLHILTDYCRGIVTCICTLNHVDYNYTIVIVSHIIVS